MNRRFDLRALVALSLPGLAVCWSMSAAAATAPSQDPHPSSVAKIQAAVPTSTTPSVPYPDHGKALPYRHDWTIHDLVENEWKRLHSGLDRRQVVPGSVIGLRFSARLAGDQRPPRHAPTVDDICGNVPDVTPERAAGIVIDYGRRVDALEGEVVEQPTRLQYVCLPNTDRELYEEALASAGVVLDGSRICRVNSYPSSGCGLAPATMPTDALAADAPITAKVLPTVTSTESRSALEVRPQPLASSGQEAEPTDNRWLPVALVAAFLAAAALVAQRLIRV